MDKQTIKRRHQRLIEEIEPLALEGRLVTGILDNGCACIISYTDGTWHGQVMLAKDVSNEWEAKTLLKLFETGLRRYNARIYYTLPEDWQAGPSTSDLERFAREHGLNF